MSNIPSCFVCNDNYVNLAVHLAKKHKIYSQSRSSINTRAWRFRIWLRAKLEDMEI